MRLGRAPWTVSREVARNGGRLHLTAGKVALASHAFDQAFARACQIGEPAVKARRPADSHWSPKVEVTSTWPS